MKKAVLIFSAALILCAAALVWWLMVTADRRAVCRLAESVAALAHKEASNLPHAGILKFGKLDELFCEKVVIRSVKPPYDGNPTREELKLMLTAAFRRVDHMDVHTGKITAEVSGGTALFFFDAEVSGAVKGWGGEYAEVVKVSGSAVKTDGKWKVSSLIVEPVVR